MNALKFVGISGSLRKKSRNSGMLRCASKNLPQGVSMDIADISQLPFYNEDIEKTGAVSTLIELVSGADAVVLGCPEYNYSMAPALKNALDWLSREPRNLPLEGKPAAIMGAGGGMGTSRSQYHLRQTCVFLNLRLLNKPEVFSNAFSASFNEAGDVQDDALVGMITKQMAALADWTRKVK